MEHKEKDISPNANANAALARTWKHLQTELQYHESLDYAAFKDAFEQTHKLLSKTAKDAKIGKEYLMLIVNAYNFATLDANQANDAATAALVMTERMLQSCVLDPRGTAPVNGVTLYILEGREELFLDFTNVDASIKLLQESLNKSQR